MGDSGVYLVVDEEGRRGDDPGSDPGVEVAADTGDRFLRAAVGLEAIDREYQTKKLNYDNLLTQQQKIDVGADAAKDFQGGGIQVVDPANLPERPVAPKRFALTAAGFGIGLALGLVLAIAVEIRRLFTIQTTEDAKHYTGLTVLASIPELTTPAEARAIPRRHAFVMVAGGASPRCIRSSRARPMSASTGSIHATTRRGRPSPKPSTRSWTFHRLSLRRSSRPSRLR